LLLLVIFYVYAILGVQLFGRNDPVNFGTIGMSMVSLFRIVTLEDWTDLLYRQMFGSAVYQYSDFPDVAPESNPMPVIAVIYFVSFVLLGTMIVLNLFVGVILNGMSDNQAKAEFRKLAEARRNQNLSVNEEVRLLSAKVDELKEGLDLIEARIIGENEYGKRRRNRFLRSRRKRQLRVLSGGESSVG
ncbi:MAG: ion transporter, partial [Bdellovibrionales bacterium]|nr:ion transporter [Bdellovibrionales bacterium]